MIYSVTQNENQFEISHFEPVEHLLSLTSIIYNVSQGKLVAADPADDPCNVLKLYKLESGVMDNVGILSAVLINDIKVNELK